MLTSPSPALLSLVLVGLAGGAAFTLGAPPQELSLIHI